MKKRHFNVWEIGTLLTNIAYMNTITAVPPRLTATKALMKIYLFLKENS